MASRYTLTEEDKKLFLIEGDHKWVRGKNAYLAKRKNILFINVLVEDVNSTMEHDVTRHNFILNYCKVNHNETTGKLSLFIWYSEFNNNKIVDISEDLTEFVKAYATDIAKKYFD